MNKKIFWINLINSVFYMSFHILISIFFSFIYSNSINSFVLLMGTFLFSMAMPSLINFKKDYFSYLIKIVLITNILFLIFLINYNFSFFNFNYITGLSISIILGFLSGFELPFFINTNEKKVLISDYIGTFLGTIFIPIIMYPFLGIYKSIIISLILYNLFNFYFTKKIYILMINLIYILFLILH